MNKNTQVYTRAHGVALSLCLNGYIKLKDKEQVAISIYNHFATLEEDPTPTEHYLNLTQEENESRLEENFNGKN